MHREHRQPRQIRKREFAYMALAAALALLLYARLEADDVSQLVIEEAHQRAVLSHPIGYAATMQTCAGIRCEPVQYYFRSEQ